MPPTDPSPADSTGVHQIDAPSDLLGRSTLVHVDHQDCFVVEIGDDVSEHTAVQWARAIFEDAPAETRDRLVAGWPLLGLRLGPLDSDEHVLGWCIRRNHPDEALLSADGNSGISAELLVERRGETLRFSSFIEVRSPAAHRMWVDVAPRHIRTVRELLTELRARARTN